MTRSILVSAIILTAVIGCRSPELTVTETKDALLEFDVTLEFEELIEEVQEFRRSSGVPLPVPKGVDERYSNRLQAVSEEYYLSRLEPYERFLARLMAMETQRLSFEDRINADILEWQLRNEIENLRFRNWLVPISVAGGFHIGLARYQKDRPFERVQEYDDFIARLQSYRKHVGLQVDLMRQGITEGMTLTREQLEGFEQTVTYHIVDDIEESHFYEPFRAIPDAFSGADRERILRDGEQAIRESVIPGMKELHEFIEGEYKPNARHTEGVHALPGGERYYEFQVRFYTTSDITPEELHRFGLDLAEETLAEMVEVMETTGFSGSFEEFLRYLRTDEQFYADSEEEYLKEAAYIAKQMEAQLPSLFKELPRTPYGIVKIPDFIAPRSVGAYYRVGSPGNRPGYFACNVYDITMRPRFVIEPLTFHEGVPGHHLQIMLQRENETISPFRRGYEVAVFIEGWAQYSEWLGIEAGFYTDPYRNIGRLTYEMFRAGRIVVNTGIHAMGWTRDEAIDFLYDRVPFTRQRLINEVDRHFSGNAYPVTYKYGEQKIRELRRRAEAMLGEDFDMREFHYQVLRNGSITLGFLEEHIESWIDETIRELAEKEDGAAAAPAGAPGRRG